MRFDILKERAIKFYNYAKRFYEEGDYDMSAFYIEQSMQFFLKYLLLKETGFFPKTHDLELLFKSLGKIYPEVLSFFEEYEDEVWNIYYAYINSRYGDKEYTKSIVEHMLSVLDKFYDLIKKWI